MHKMAMNIQPVLLASLVFSPNSKSRKKARETIRLNRKLLGNLTASERFKSFAVIITAAIGSLHILVGKITGLGDIVYQLRVNRVEFHS
jgi:hypothetical protein